MIILDTDVVSELMRPAGDPAVLHWVRATGDAELATTAITVAEIEYGLARVPEGARADALRSAAAGLWRTFAAAILPFDVAAANEYGKLMATRERAGSPSVRSTPRSPRSPGPTRPGSRLGTSGTSGARGSM